LDLIIYNSQLTGRLRSRRLKILSLRF